MLLRSGRYINRQESDTASRAPTRGSGTQSVGNLERISESLKDSQSDSISLTESDRSMDRNGSQDMHPSQTNAGKSATSNPFERRSWGLNFNVKLQFQYANAQGADIYKDPMGRFAVKIPDVLSNRHMNPWVNYQADMYMGEDGARYEVTEYPEHVDIMGVLLKSEQTDPRNDPLPDSNQPGTSTNPGMFSPSLDAIFSNKNEERNKGECEEEYGGDDKNSITEIKVTKVFQDDPLKEVYKDSLETYYATTKLLPLKLPVTHVILVERFGKRYNELRDKWGNDYRTLDWLEVRDLTWKGIPLFMEVSAKDTARPDTMAFQGETGPQPWKPHEKAVPTASERTTAKGPMFPAMPPLPVRGYAPRPEVGRAAGYVPAMTPLRPMRCPHIPLEDPRARIRDPPRRHDDEYSRRMRPSALQKLVKKYDGSGDPYDHVAAF